MLVALFEKKRRFMGILLILDIFVEKYLFSSETASDSRSKLARPYMFRMVINSVIASNRSLCWIVVDDPQVGYYETDHPGVKNHNSIYNFLL